MTKKPRKNVWSNDYAPYGTTQIRGNASDWRSAYEERMMGYEESVIALKTENPYSILGLSDGATDDEIKKAFRQFALKNHPDHNNAPDAEEVFKKGYAAYSYLLQK